HFIDAQPGDAYEYTATIGWGDGKTSDGWVQPDGQGGFEVVGEHTYQVAGSVATSVTVRRNAGAMIQAVAGEAAVQAVSALLATAGVPTGDETLASFDYHARPLDDWDHADVFTGFSGADYGYYQFSNPNGQLYVYRYGETWSGMWGWIRDVGDVYF